MSRFQRVGVVGAGLMGSGIAQVAATAGYPTVLRDLTEDLLARGRAGMERSLAKLVEKQALSRADATAALARVTWTTAMADLAACDLVVEAVTEDLDLKVRCWRELDGLCPAGAVFASNTSSLPIVAQAAATGRPDRFVGLHFFSPVPLMPLVEVIRAVGTSADTFDRVLAFARSLGKEAIVARDTPGFIVNRLLVPYMVDAVRAVERGVASIADIDTGMKLGAGHPIGPLALCDLVGLDVCLRVADIMYEEFRDAHYAAPPLLRRMVTGGQLGRKTGKGFYDYSLTPARPVDLP